MKKLILLLSISAIIFSCNIFKAAQSPPHNDQTALLSLSTFNNIHSMYDSMMNSTDKSYAVWQNRYSSKLYEINELLIIDSARKNNKAILKLTNDWMNRLINYSKEHKIFDELNNGQILIYQDFMDIAGRKVYLTEKYYK